MSAAPPDRPAPSATARSAALAVLALFLAGGVVLAALPYAIGYGIKHWLTSRGASPVELVDVDFNPFTGRLGLAGLSVTVEGTRVLRLGRGKVRIDWLPLLKRRIDVLEVEVSGLEAVIEHRPDGTWVGPLPPPAPDAAAAAPPGDAAKSWGFGLGTMALNDLSMRYTAPGEAHTVRIDRLVLSGPATWAPDRPAHLNLAGAVDDGGLRLVATVTPFADHPSAKGHLEVDGLSLAPFQARLPAPLDTLAGRLGLSVDLSAERDAEGLRVAQAGTVALTGIAADAGGRRARAERLDWEGSIDVTAPPAGPPAWTVAGTLESGGAGAELDPEGIRAAYHHLLLRVRAEGGAPGPYPAVTADAAVEGLAVDVPDRGVRALSLGSAAVEGLALAPSGAVDLGAVRLAGLALGGPPPGSDAEGGTPVVAAAMLDVEGIARAADGALAIDAVRVEDLVADLRRGPDGSLYLMEDVLAVLAAPAAAPPTAPAGPGEATAPPPIRIADVSIGGDSRVMFTDETVTPPFRATVRVPSATLAGLDSADPKAPARLALTAHVGTYTDVALSGTVRPFAPRLTLDLKGTVRRLELPPFSPYAARLLGYNLAAGQMDADLAVAVDRGVLSGNNRLTFRKLSVDPQDTGQMERLTQELSMPLDAALSLLRDKNDTIRMDLPVSGDLSSPDVGLSGVINRALGKALRVTAMQYAKIALQPFGALITVVQLAGKATALRLDPVAFAPGAASVDATGAAYAERIAKLLEDRPRLALRLCGHAVAADREALAAGAPAPEAAPEAAPEPVPDERLLELARLRAEAFRDVLVTAYGIPPERLNVCLPEIDAEAAAPRVDVLI